MCSGCWAEYGEPRIVNVRVLAAKVAMDALYGDHPTGGALHIVTDDWNLDDEDLAFCERWMNEKGGDALERCALATLSNLTTAERASALALQRGFFEP